MNIKLSKQHLSSFLWFRFRNLIDFDANWTIFVVVENFASTWKCLLQFLLLSFYIIVYYAYEIHEMIPTVAIFMFDVRVWNFLTVHEKQKFTNGECMKYLAQSAFSGTIFINLSRVRITLFFGGTYLKRSYFQTKMNERFTLFSYFSSVAFIIWTFRVFLQIQRNYLLIQNVQCGHCSAN